MGKFKAQGTAAELRWIRKFKAAGLDAKSQRDSGNPDADGDLEVTAYVVRATETDVWEDDWRIVGEIRDRQKMNVVAAMQRAVKRSGTHRTFIGWTKRLELPAGRTRRTTEGEVVVIPTEFFLELLGGSNGPG